MAVELAPWLSGLVIFTNTNLLAFAQSNDRERKVSGVLFAPHFYKEAREMDDSWVQVFVAWAMLPTTVAVLIEMANLGKIRFFLPGTIGLVTRPFLLLAMYY